MNTERTEVILNRLIVILIFGGVFAIIGIVGLQAYSYLINGVWDWETVADLLTLTGQDPVAILDPQKQWGWAGVAEITRWFFYTAPAALVVSLAAGALLWLIGVMFSH